MKPLEVWNEGVDLDDDLLRALYDLGRCADGGT
jgi:hypothetical protein